VWAKGYTELLDLLSKEEAQTGAARGGGAVAVDCYGTGEDLEAVREEAGRRRLSLSFHGAKDHLDPSLHDYRVFVNPSLSDVVATTTAEALAMGKWVVCAEHPSNHFFKQFSNCLIYRWVGGRARQRAWDLEGRGGLFTPHLSLSLHPSTNHAHAPPPPHHHHPANSAWPPSPSLHSLLCRTPEEFSANLHHALNNDPNPMPPAERSALTWEAATERFLDVSELSERDLRPGPLTQAVDSLAYLTHHALCGEWATPVPKCAWAP
jgi:hypothetical protein